MDHENSFGEDVEFLTRHVDTRVLRTGRGDAIAVVPAYQGRVMTSSGAGDAGTSHGWINYARVASPQRDPQINLYGGEERMWLGPEGGQFALFFDPGTPLDFENWRTPSAIDTEPFAIVAESDRHLAFSREVTLRNYAGFDFKMGLSREVHLLEAEAVEASFGMGLGGLTWVAHESHNSVSNRGTVPWTQEQGLPGIWMLCMSKPSSGATVVVPFRTGTVEELGPIVNADYFGRLEEDRLRIDEAGGRIYFLGDGKMRSKIGLGFHRVQPRLASWDSVREVLTVVEFNLPAEAPHGYTNNVWQLQDNPFDGDVINSYNDGPNESGGMLGPFFELETLSPALALAPAETYTHRHRTVRMEGPRSALSAVADRLLGVGLDEIENVFQ